MKKTIILSLVILFSTMQAFCETQFTKALTNCSPYSINGTIPFQGEVYNLKISLQKSKGLCNYKERIFQDTGYQELVCNFNTEQTKSIAASMAEFSTKYKNQLEKNKIFEAKLTSNPVVFEKYLINPSICEITQSVSKSKKR